MLKKKGTLTMKKLICLIAALMLIFTACGNNDAENNTAPDGVVEDGDGIIDENGTADNDTQTGVGDAVDDAADNVTDAADDVVDGASDAARSALDGMGNAARDMTGNR